MKIILWISVLALLAIGTQGCLKTRAQLRGDGGSHADSSDEKDNRDISKSTPAPPVQDVHPQGSYVVEELKDEITHLSGRIEDLERQAKDSEQDSLEADEEIIKKLDVRVAQLEKNQAGLQDALDKFKESLAPKDPIDLMKEAKSLYGEGKYQEGIDKLGHYLHIPKVKNADEATFLRGEGYYQLKQFKKAIVEYSKFPETYTHSSHFPEALYKIALSFDALGMKDDAKGFYQELVEKFPKSAQAKKVKKHSK